MKEMVGGCCVCSDERGWPDNPLVYCDGNGCTVAVHQACYGIVTVPTGPWYCRKCESLDTKGKVRCELCPSRSGALKKTDTGGWAHVVCALYIPEVRFGNVTSMEPIVLRLVPPERYNKTCYICHDIGKPHRATAGACMQCNKSGCKQQFHVTCAQSLGMLCEEAGNYLDNVKYCGYCQHHYSKLFTNHEVTVIAKKKGGNVKTIPPYKPVSHDSHSSDSSCDKEGAGSPQAAGSGTPTHTNKSKGPGRKSSHSGSGKNTPSSAKQAANTPLPLDLSEEATEPAVTRKHKSSEKHKKKSPSRRGSSTGDGGSKASTPAPSPQHNPEPPTPVKVPTSQAQTPKATPPSPPISKPAEAVPSTVISSVASAIVSTPSTVPTSAPVSTPPAQPPKPVFQESVITNTEAMDTKHTKKRKAAAAAAAAAAAINAANAASANEFTPNGNIVPNTIETPTSQAQSSWEQQNQAVDLQEPAEKIMKKVAKDHEAQSHFSSIPIPPPPAHSPASQPSPRHMQQSPMPGPSGMNPPTSTIRSPSHHQQIPYYCPTQMRGEPGCFTPDMLMNAQRSYFQHYYAFVVNLFYHYMSTVMVPPPDMVAMAPHIFHQPQKQATVESNVSGHPVHPHPHRAWSGLNMTYEQQQHAMQQDPNRPGGSGMAGHSKENNVCPMPPMPPGPVRNKKRAAMSSAAALAHQALHPPSNIQMAASSSQNMAGVRRPPQPTPPPMYQDPPKESPPSSPGTDRVMKKPEPKRWKRADYRESCLSPREFRMTHTAPHMLGNELNPESGAAARLQEQLTAELAAHAAGSAGPDPLVPPPLMNKAGGHSVVRGSSSAQSLDQLLERQWEQGSQFLMEQAQHFDIASLLSCLHQLRTENVRLEEHVANLLQRRDHLLAVNARLAIPLTTATANDPARCSRDIAQIRPPPPPRAEPMPDNRQHQAMAVDQRSHQLMMREVQQKPS